MTIYRERRGRRSLAAILAAMLMASVLAVVAGSPAQAANTSSEVRIDHDNNAETPDVREFAGTDRYDTALRLAANFATSKGGLGAVPAVFVASGETLVDSISAAGLADDLDAPIVLTKGDSLHRGVADFIEDYGISTVYVLGGPAAVADSVLDEIKALASNPGDPVRLWGPDRYATAARIAGEIVSDSSWCGTDEVSAVLINGATDELAFGVAVQTAAYRLRLPVLMTMADELPDATADYITDNDVEHVQIVGGEGTVSASVASALTSLGVNVVDRVPGDSAADVSVELAKLAGNGCGDSLAPVSTDRVALVRGNPDGVVAAPVLASSLDNGEMVTPLIVGDTLPASVREYLAGTPQTVGAAKQHLGVVAVGGTAAVSEAVMTAAVEAARSAGGTLSVQISDHTDTNNDGTIGDENDPVRPDSALTPVIRLHFSDAVDAAAPATLEALRDIVKINGRSAVISSIAAAPLGGACSATGIDVTLGEPLRAGHTISVVNSAAPSHAIGTGGDARNIASASTTVQAEAPDRTRPVVSIVGIAGAAGNHFHVTVTDAGGNLPAVASIPALVDSGADQNVSLQAAQGTPTITAAAVWTSVVPNRVARTTVNVSRALVAGDRLTVDVGAVEDTLAPIANRSLAASQVAIAPQPSPRITSVQMSNLDPDAQNSWQLAGSSAPIGASTGAGGTNEITIAARASGAAAGAAGNGWQIRFDVSGAHNSTQPVDIDVEVDDAGRKATVRIVNGTPTVGDLLGAMRDDADFDELFSVGIPCAGSLTAELAPDNSSANRNTLATSAGTGRTEFAIETHFSAYIDQYNDLNLFNGVLAATRGRAVPAAVDVDALLQAMTTTTSAYSANGSDIDPARPVTMVRWEFEVANASHLPANRDLVRTGVGAAGNFVAEGFATGAGQYNAASQVRIAVSSRVAAP